MNRLNNPVSISIGVFFVVLLVGLSSNELFNRYYARESLSRDNELMLYLFRDAVMDAESALNEVPGPEGLQCSEQVVESLAYDVFRHPSVRWLGIEWPDGNTCYSGFSHIDTQLYNLHPINEGFALAASKDDQGNTDILVVKKREGVEYIAALNPFMYEFMAEFACTDCLEYELRINAEPLLSFQQNQIDGPVAVTSESQVSTELLDATMVMAGNTDFFDYYQSQSVFAASLLSLLLASLSSAAAYRVLTRRQSLERLVQQGIDAQEFVPFYQGIVDSSSGEVVGAEVLVRWIKADGTVVPPYQFIGTAEDCGLILPITEQLIAQVAEDLVTLGWRDGQRFASINIVPEHLNDESLLNTLKSQGQKHGVPLQNFAIEITERKKIENLNSANKAIGKYHQLGMDVKLDDAGTGYGGFSYIQELGIRTLKIDKMFVDTIEFEEDAKRKVLDAIVEFARRSGLATIAEGVETLAQVEYLAALGVTTIQGYVYSKPMPIGDFVKWLSVPSAARKSSSKTAKHQTSLSC